MKVGGANCMDERLFVEVVPGLLRVRSGLTIDQLSAYEMYTHDQKLSASGLLNIARSCVNTLPEFGDEVNLSVEARSIAAEIRNVVRLDHAGGVGEVAFASVFADDIRRLMRDVLVRDCRIIIAVNVRLGTVREVRDRASFWAAVAEACGSGTDLVRLLFDAVRRNHGSTREERRLCLTAEIPRAALAAYMSKVGNYVVWNSFATFETITPFQGGGVFTESGMIVVVFELRSAGRPLLPGGRTKVVPPFTIFRIDAVADVVRLVEVAPTSGPKNRPVLRLPFGLIPGNQRIRFAQTARSVPLQDMSPNCQGE
jgi:hypothetical protein